MICQKCGKHFTTTQAEIRRGGGKFCSPKCWYSSGLVGNPGKRRTPCVIKICRHCGKQYELPSYRDKRGNNKYCSTKCRYAAYNGPGNPNFRNSETIKKCKLCGKDFKVRKHRLNSGRGVFCSHTCSATYGAIHGKKKSTSIEIRMEKELTRRGIVFQKQYPIYQARTIPDFFIPPNICIYCDGDYWHSKPLTAARDLNQNFTLKFLGFEVYRFWEREINKSIEKCVDKIRLP